MTPWDQAEDRRQGPRFGAAGLDVALRRRGRFGAIAARALDFNRHGIAVSTTQPISKDRPVYLSLRCGAVCVDNVVGVVHNCVRQGNRFRCGIRFRLGSALQRDRRKVEALLQHLESVAEAD